MIRICAWCKANLDPAQKGQDGPITHGICDDCLKLMLDGSSSMDEFLDSLPQPILVVDSDARVLASNQAACDFLGKDREALGGTLGGEAMECIHSRAPGGCGGTVHCKSCTIRNSVTRTYATGRACWQVLAHMDLIDSNSKAEVRFLISTEKLGDTVLLQIDDVAPAAADEN